MCYTALLSQNLLLSRDGESVYFAISSKQQKDTQYLMMASLGDKDKDSPYKIRIKKSIIFKLKGSRILYFDLDHESEQKNVNVTNDDLYLVDSN